MIARTCRRRHAARRLGTALAAAAALLVLAAAQPARAGEKLSTKRVREGGKGVRGAPPTTPMPASTIGDADLNVLIAWVLETP